MVIGTKFREVYDYAEPLPEDYDSDEEYCIAKAQYQLKNLFPFKETTLKRYAMKVFDNIEIKKDVIIRIKRWDDNGIDSETKVKEIHFEGEFPEVICEDGWFYFNPNEEYNTFNWRGKGKSWEKKNKKWVKTDNYFIEIR